MEAANSANVVQKYFIDVIRYKYIQYQGRARRKEYWLFSLFCAIIYFIVAFVSIIDPSDKVTVAMDILYWLAYLALFAPSICLGIRRLHDIGKSGWWLLLMLIPVLGWIVLVVFACLDSQPGENQYGPNPKAVEPLTIA